MRTLLICHDKSALSRDGIARWLASFSDLAGIVAIREGSQGLRRRIRREVKRVGPLRFLDVLAFQVYYRIFLARTDRGWEQKHLTRLHNKYPDIPSGTPVLHTRSPNSEEAERFIKKCAPDIIVARCKVLLKERIFTIPPGGTFVMHPGICPEYRNAHGCFWALANDDLDKVGMSLLQIDRGVDTGPVYAYYGCDFDEIKESHITIQHRTVFDNLDRIQEKLREIHENAAVPLDTSGRPSAAWGQPWLSRYLTWKRRARRRRV